MAKIKVSGSASGIGTVTLIAPATATDRTLTLPDATGTLVNTAPSTSGNVLTSDGTNWTSAAAAAGGIANVVEDTTPQLGGNLDFNGNKATSFTSTGIDDNADATAITINIAEDVGIGTTGPNYRLDVSGESRFTQKVRCQNGSYAIEVSGGNPMQASSVSNSSGTTALWDSNGGLYKSASSRRYKENLSPMNVSVEAIDAFLDVEPQFWDYKPQEGSEADAITGLAGFIAEDLATLDVISEGKCVLVNYANIAGVGEPDNFVPDSNRESALFAMLQQAIKKQRDAIKLLEARIEQLEVI